MDIHIYFAHLWSAAGSTLAIICSVWAFWRGETPERWGALILLTAWIVTPMVQHRGPEGPGTGPWVVLVDSLTFLAFTALSLWSRRLWTLFIAAFQLNAVASHFAGALSGHIAMFSLLTGLGLWGGYGIVFALAAGMWALERRRFRAKT